jgi:hypothetical protein
MSKPKFIEIDRVFKGLTTFMQVDSAFVHTKQIYSMKCSQLKEGESARMVLIE